MSNLSLGYWEGEGGTVGSQGQRPDPAAQEGHVLQG